MTTKTDFEAYGQGATLHGIVPIEQTIDTMEHSGYFARIMAAPRLVGDYRHPLPPGYPMRVIPIACLPGCPDDWVRSAGTYVIPVIEDVGIWFDWTQNAHQSIAIVPSVKKMNPITGLALDSLEMVQYRDRCPKHDIPFSHGRVCEECGYAWPPQNYVSAPNILWWDGFRRGDGLVSQFFYTADVKRDVASAVIGKENTVPAFGFGIFRDKNFIPESERPKRQSFSELLKSKGFGSKDLPFTHKAYAYNPPSAGGMSSSSGSFSGAIHTKNMTYSAGLPGEMKGWKNRVSDSFDESVSVNLCSVESDLKGTALSPDTQVETHHAFTVREEMGDVIVPKRLGAVDTAALARAMVEPIRRSTDYSEPETQKREVSIGGGATIEQELVVDNRPLEDFHSEPQAVFRIYFVFPEELATIVRNGGVKKLDTVPEGFLKNVPTG